MIAILFLESCCFGLVPNKSLQILGSNIKRLRIENGIRAVDLANKCDFERSNLARIERGDSNITLLNLLKIARALDVSIEELVKGTDKEERI